jgi:hypothetical protein
MRLIESAAELQSRLDEAGIGSIVIGGIAVAVWGDPRLTRDVDFKVLLDRNQIDLLFAALGPSYVALDRDPAESLRTLGFAFFRDPHGIRVDTILADTSFDREAVDRAVEVELAPGSRVRLCSAEDLIVYKLISTRPRDHEDARGIVRRQSGRLDDAYVERWLHEFEVALDDSTLSATYRGLRDRNA